MGTETSKNYLGKKAILWTILVLLSTVSLLSCSPTETSQTPSVADLTQGETVQAPANQSETAPMESSLPISSTSSVQTVIKAEPTATPVSPNPALTPTSEPAVPSPSISSFLSVELLPQTLFEFPASEITALVVSPNSQTVAFALADRTIHLMNADGSGMALTFEGHSAKIRDLAFSPDGSTLASAGEDSTVMIWDTRDGSEVREINTSFVGRALAVEFSPDGSQLAIGGHKCFVALYTIWSGILNRTLVQPGCRLKQEGSVDYWTIAFSPDGSEVLTADGQPSGSGGSIQNWDLEPVAYPVTIKALGVGISTMAVSPDGEWIAVSLIGSSNILLIAVEDGRILDPLEGHVYRVNSVAFSYDGKILASGSTDGTVRLWDVANGLLLRTLEGHDSPINAAAFSPDGTFIVSGSDDGSVMVWSLSSPL